MEVMEEYQETKTVTQTFTVQNLETMGLHFDHEGISQSALSSQPSRPKDEVFHRRSTSSRAEDDWIEVMSDTPDELDDIPSIPNGSSSAGTRAYREALEQPTGNTERIQFVLKTMTSKFMQRKRTVRPIQSIRYDAPSTCSSNTDLFSITDVRLQPVNATGDIYYKTVPAGPSHASNSTSRSYEDICTQKAESSATPIKKAISKAKTALRPLTPRKRSVRPASPLPRDKSRCSPPRDKEEPKRVPPTPPNTVQQSPNQPKRAKNALRPVDEAIRTASHRMQLAATSTVASTPMHGSKDWLYPRGSLIHNLHRFMRFSSAAYGVGIFLASNEGYTLTGPTQQNFLRIFGMGDADCSFPSTEKHHANSWSFVGFLHL